MRGLTIDLGTCQKHGQKQLFATPINSNISVCVQCAVEAFSHPAHDTGIHLVSSRPESSKCGGLK